MEMEFDGEYDVICAGAGIGGLSAAITAAEKGARVLVLEKFDKLGGVTALSSGHLWPGPNVVSEKLGIADTNEQAQAYITHFHKIYQSRVYELVTYHEAGKLSSSLLKPSG
jgi:3-oxosteroid 1-dehydrogenase